MKKRLNSTNSVLKKVKQIIPAQGNMLRAINRTGGKSLLKANLLRMALTLSTAVPMYTNSAGIALAVNNYHLIALFAQKMEIGNCHEHAAVFVSSMQEEIKKNEKLWKGYSLEIVEDDVTFPDDPHIFALVKKGKKAIVADSWVGNGPEDVNAILLEDSKFQPQKVVLEIPYEPEFD